MSNARVTETVGNRLPQLTAGGRLKERVSASTGLCVNCVPNVLEQRAIAGPKPVEGLRPVTIVDVG